MFIVGYRSNSLGKLFLGVLGKKSRDLFARAGTEWLSSMYWTLLHENSTHHKSNFNWNVQETKEIQKFLKWHKKKTIFGSIQDHYKTISARELEEGKNRKLPKAFMNSSKSLLILSLYVLPRKLAAPMPRPGAMSFWDRSSSKMQLRWREMTIGQRFANLEPNRLLGELFPCYL